MIRLLLIMFSVFSLHVSGQSDALNQLNDKGEKNGYWLQYLDSMAYPTDSINAYFFGYDLYDNGQKVSRYAGRNNELEEYDFVFDGYLPEKGKPIAINGLFRWFRNGTQIVNMEIYKDGNPVYANAFQYSESDQKNPTYNEVLYFARLYHNIPGTFYWEEHWYRKVGKKYWFRRGPKGWRSYRIRKYPLPKILDVLTHRIPNYFSSF